MQSESTARKSKSKSNAAITKTTEACTPPTKTLTARQNPPQPRAKSCPDKPATSCPEIDRPNPRHASLQRPPFRSNKGKVTVTAVERVGSSGHVFSDELNNKRLDDSGRTPYHPRKAPAYFCQLVVQSEKSFTERKATNFVYIQ